MILLDSSAWIDALSSDPTIPKNMFVDVIESGEAVTIRPVVDEILCHPDPKTLLALRDALRGVERIDRDWNSDETWDELHNMARYARRHQISPLGVVDRMVMLSAKKAGAVVWTLERKAVRLAVRLGLKVF